MGGYEKAMKKAAKEIDLVAQGWLEDHKGRWLSGEGNEKRDFIDVMLGLFDTVQNKPSEFEADTIIKATSIVSVLPELDLQIFL